MTHCKVCKGPARRRVVLGKRRVVCPLGCEVTDRDVVLMQQAKAEAKAEKEEPALRTMREYSITVTVDVSATTKERALAGVRSCFGPSAQRITRIIARERG